MRTTQQFALLLAVVDAALDQPTPTDNLRLALNTWLQYSKSPLAVSGPVRPLTPTETTVARLVADGLTVRQIANVIGTTENTAANHLKAIAAKLPNPDGLKRSRLIAEWALLKAA